MAIVVKIWIFPMWATSEPVRRSHRSCPPPAPRLAAPHPHPGVRDEGGGGEEGIPPDMGL